MNEDDTFKALARAGIREMIEIVRRSPARRDGADFVSLLKENGWKLTEYAKEHVLIYDKNSSFWEDMWNEVLDDFDADGIRYD